MDFRSRWAVANILTRRFLKSLEIYRPLCLIEDYDLISMPDDIDGSLVLVLLSLLFRCVECLRSP
jgi:hypothetical protein